MGKEFFVSVALVLTICISLIIRGTQSKVIVDEPDNDRRDASCDAHANVPIKKLLIQRDLLVNELGDRYADFYGTLKPYHSLQNQKTTIELRMAERIKNGFHPHNRPSDRRTREGLDAIHNWESQNLDHNRDSIQASALAPLISVMLSQHDTSLGQIHQIKTALDILLTVIQQLDVIERVSTRSNEKEDINKPKIYETEDHMNQIKSAVDRLADAVERLPTCTNEKEDTTLKMTYMKAILEEVNFLRSHIVGCGPTKC